MQAGSEKMTKVKICGITNLEDALISVRFGADALGFNFYEKSPRYIVPEMAREIIDRLPQEILKVGVFVNESIKTITETCEIAGLDAIQLHGEEPPRFVSDLLKLTDRELIKAFRVFDGFRPEDTLDYDVDGVLLDGFSKSERGGTGKIFDWNIARMVSTLTRQLYLAGGLSSKNVRSAISKVRPYAVDACSSIESAPGKKNPENLRRFITEAKRND